MLVDDRRSAVALPETPLLAVLPGTGGLTRVTDKRKVRRDRADVFCSIEEGMRGAKAVEWRLVDEVVPQFEMERRRGRARARDRRALRPAEGCQGHHADAARAQDRRRPRLLFARRRGDRPRRAGSQPSQCAAPSQAVPASVEAAHALGAKFWPLAVARELEDAILHLRTNEAAIGVVAVHAPKATPRPCSITTISSPRPMATG